jgi:murein L,D-transpeptidase YcbB/YkuD
VAGLSSVFDDFVARAVRHFQIRHGLVPTGIVTAGTLKALDVPAGQRLRQLTINIARLQAHPPNADRRFVVANLPAALVETVEDGRVATRHIAGVGKADRPSPVMQTQAIDINFNPFWTVPASIVRKDLIPRMQADPSYLTASHIRIFETGGREVSPSTIDWHALAPSTYRYRQDPGSFNALGRVRINIANPYGVYMHDTPDKGDFGDDDRFVSSGCIHVQGVRDYVTWLLAETPGWTRDRVDAALDSDRRIDVTLAQPVPVLWVYVTAWATPDGTAQFRDDIYGRDGPSAVSNAPGLAKPNS